MNNDTKQALITYFAQYITPNKQAKIAATLADRTRHVTVVIEDIFQTHNASAIVRSCEILGSQDLHVVEKMHEFNPKDTIAMGASKWMNIIRYNSSLESIAALKKQGYVIAATVPKSNAYLLHEVPLDHKIALIFGTENAGLTQAALDEADLMVKIPMYGFTQSFNVSVSVALCLYDLITRLRASSLNWQLTDQEKLDLTLNWYRALVRGAQTHEQQFLNTLNF